jgi:hypothetical protein
MQASCVYLIILSLGLVSKVVPTQGKREEQGTTASADGCPGFYKIDKFLGVFIGKISKS